MQKPGWPAEPYEFLVWWHCGYPASDAACGKGWESLRKVVGIEPERLLETPDRVLAEALRPGGMVPELRAMRLKEVAARVVRDFGGDLRAGLAGPVAEARKKLKAFPGIADPGVDRILLFGRVAPVAAVPSNCPHVLVRIERGLERENYGVTYGEARESIESGLPETFEARQRAYLLLKVHGQSICKKKPRCGECSVSDDCAFFGGKLRGRAPAPA